MVVYEHLIGRVDRELLNPSCDWSQFQSCCGKEYIVLQRVSSLIMASWCVRAVRQSYNIVASPSLVR